MDMSEIRKLPGDQVDAELDRLQRRLFDLRCQAVTEKIEDTSQFGKIKKDLARVLTEQTERRRRAAGTA